MLNSSFYRKLPYYLLYVSFALNLLCMLLYFGADLFLDEYGTIFVVDKDFLDMLRRGWYIQGNSPLYYVIVWINSRIFGTSILSIRLPSLIGMICALFVWNKLSKKHFPHISGLWVLLTYVYICNVAAVFIYSARAYPLALLFGIISTYLFFEFLKSHSKKDLCLWVGASVVMIYFHYTFATLTAILIVTILIIKQYDRVQIRYRHLGMLCLVLTLMLLPALWHIIYLRGRVSELVHIKHMSLLESLTETLNPSIVIFAALFFVSVGLGAIVVREPKSCYVLLKTYALKLSSLMGLIAVAIAFGVPLLTYFMGEVIGASLSHHKYIMASKIGLCLLWTLFPVSIIEGGLSERMRTISLSLVALLLLPSADVVFGIAERRYSIRHETSLIRELDPNGECLLLLNDSFVEGNAVIMGSTPLLREFAGFPFSYHLENSLEFVPHRSSPQFLPMGYLEELKLKAEDKLAERLRHFPCVIFREYDQVSLNRWLKGVLKKDGFVYTQKRRSHGMKQIPLRKEIPFKVYVRS